MKESDANLFTEGTRSAHPHQVAKAMADAVVLDVNSQYLNTASIWFGVLYGEGDTL